MLRILKLTSVFHHLPRVVPKQYVPAKQVLHSLFNIDATMVKFSYGEISINYLSIHFPTILIHFDQEPHLPDFKMSKIHLVNR